MDLIFPTTFFCLSNNRLCVARRQRDTPISMRLAARQISIDFRFPFWEVGQKLTSSLGLPKLVSSLLSSSSLSFFFLCVTVAPAGLAANWLQTDSL
jgi:hypothetical protein